jgi:hypothetical protein
VRKAVGIRQQAKVKGKNAKKATRQEATGKAKGKSKKAKEGKRQ